MPFFAISAAPEFPPPTLDRNSVPKRDMSSFEHHSDEGRTLRRHLCHLMILTFGNAFEFADASVRDLGARQVQLSKVIQPFQVLQSGVRDLGFPQVQYHELGQAVEVY